LGPIRPPRSRDEALAGKVNYLLGKDRVNWYTGLPPTRGRSTTTCGPESTSPSEPGTGKLKYEFRLAPGARASDIRLAYRGADRLALGRAGGLRIDTAAGSPP